MAITAVMDLKPNSKKSLKWSIPQEMLKQTNSPSKIITVFSETLDQKGNCVHFP